MLPDTSAIDNALIGKLLADTTLMALVPDGIYYGEASPGKQRFVIVSLITGQDVWQFGAVQKRRAYEDKLYLVKAVMLSTAGGNIQQAAYRIDQLLEDGTLDIPGYTLMAMYREQPERFLEVDDVDPSIRWNHRGGQYRVQATPTS